MSETLIVYYSHTGHTKQIAEAIGKLCEAALEPLRSPIANKGPFAYLRMLFTTLTRLGARIEDPAHDPADYDLVVVGTPVWGFSMTPPVRTFLSHYSESMRRTAFFCTQGGAGDQKVFRQMQKKSGLTPIATLAITEPEMEDKAALQVRLQAFADKLRNL